MNFNQFYEDNYPPDEEEINPAVGKGKYRLSYIIDVHLEWNLKSEELASELPGLTESQAKAAILHYQRHKEIIDTIIKRDNRNIEELLLEKPGELSENIAHLSTQFVRYFLHSSCRNSLAMAIKEKNFDIISASEVWLIGKPINEVLAYTHATKRVLLTHEIDYLEYLEENPKDHYGILCMSPSCTTEKILDTLTVIDKFMMADQLINKTSII